MEFMSIGTNAFILDFYMYEPLLSPRWLSSGGAGGASGGAGGAGTREVQPGTEQYQCSNHRTYGWP